MQLKNFQSVIVLGLATAGIFLVECAAFRFPFSTGIDVLWLVWFTFVIGVIVVLSMQHSFSLGLSGHEILSLGYAMGFGVFPTVSAMRHFFGFDHLQPPYPAIITVVIIALVAPLVANLKRIPREEYKKIFYVINDVWIFAIGALLFFAAYNLQQFHYGTDGSIITHGLFGVDIPFLAGEVHGIQDFGSLRDLHQMGQPWQYHDWTYQLIALLGREHTLPDLAFGAPLVGYTMLAFSIFTLVLRLTGSKYISYIAVALWFLVSGLEGGELSSYALSPSFVFGSMIFVNVLLALDLRLKTKERKKQWVFSAILLFLLIELSQTKLSSYLVIMGGMGLLGLLFIRKERKLGLELLAISFTSFAIVVWQTSKPNPLMPGGDFLIGAPLLGYANHVAAILHVPVSAINPVSHGLAFHWQSILIIPLFIFHFLRFAIVDPKILSAIIAIIVLRKLLWKGSREIVLLLILLVPLGFLLPVLYSPAWYPLALSFYAPLMSVQAALILVATGLGMFLQQKMIRPAKFGMGLIGLLCLIGVGLQVHSILKEDAAKQSVVSASLMHAMDYLQANASDTDIIATHRFDLDTASDESYYWYSALSGRRVVSEGAKYGSLLGGVADTNAEKGMHRIPVTEEMLRMHRGLLDTIYNSRDSTHVNAAIFESGVSFIVEDSYGDSSELVHSKLASRRVFESGGYRILKVGRSLVLNFLN